MTPVIVALFDDYGVADRVRTELVAEGLPNEIDSVRVILHRNKPVAVEEILH